MRNKAGKDCRGIRAQVAACGETSLTSVMTAAQTILWDGLEDCRKHFSQRQASGFRVVARRSHLTVARHVAVE